MSLLSYREAIVADIKAAIPTLRTVETHRGRFDSAAEIKRYGLAAPAVLIAITAGDPAPIASGTLRIDAGVALYVITRDQPQLARDAGALAIVEALLRHAQDNLWRDAALAAPKNFRAANLYAGAIDKLGVALWAVTFDQAVEIEPTLDPATLAAFEIFHQDTDIAPADGDIDISQTTEIPQ